MKRNNSKNAKKQNFLRIPTFPGGKEAYKQFIRENIVYPKQAISNRIEGSVYLVYNVNNLGEVEDVAVTKGIGFGCDEEAIRIIRLMKYEPARNRGVKMKAEMKTRINFNIQEVVQPAYQADLQLKYISTTPENKNSPEPKSGTVYNYTINLNN